VRFVSRVVRLLALVAVALSVGWLLLRRRIRPAPTLRVVRDPAPALPVEPRRPEPLSALGRPVHDTAEATEADPDSPAAPVATVAPPPAAAAVPLGEPASGAGHDDERSDDLRRIRGVGPAIESVLHGLGIRSYRQLLMLDEAGLDRVRDGLRDFRQRIEREDWIGQARLLHREKYGEEA